MLRAQPLQLQRRAALAAAAPRSAAALRPRSARSARAAASAAADAATPEQQRQRPAFRVRTMREADAPCIAQLWYSELLLAGHADAPWPSLRSGASGGAAPDTAAAARPPAEGEELRRRVEARLLERERRRREVGEVQGHGAGREGGERVRRGEEAQLRRFRLVFTLSHRILQKKHFPAHRPRRSTRRRLTSWAPFGGGSRRSSGSRSQTATATAAAASAAVAATAAAARR